MKTLLLLLTLSIFASCNEDKKEEMNVDKNQEEMTMENGDSEEAAMEEASSEEAPQAGIAEENDQCICTKDYSPVCGSNGVTYPNACQAGCEKVSDFTDGPCAEESEQAEDQE